MLDNFANYAYNFRQGEVNRLPVYIAPGVDYKQWRLTQHYDFTALGASENSENGVVTHRSENATTASALIEVPAGPTIKLTNNQGHWKLHIGLIVLTPRQALQYAIKGKHGLKLLSPDRARQDMIDNLFREKSSTIDDAIADAKLNG
jgi:hypothetical protein